MHLYSRKSLTSAMVSVIITVSLTQFTSQLPVNEWYEIIGKKTVADAIMDRLVHNAHQVELIGASMRRKRTEKLIEI